MGGAGERGGGGAPGLGRVGAGLPPGRSAPATMLRYRIRRGLARKGCTLKRSRIRRAARALLFASLALAVFPAAAQGYPSKPIHLLLPFAGGTDAVARLLAFKLSPALGEQVLPEQRLGAGGNIAHRAVAEAAPDGYTLLMGAPPLVINPHLNPTAGYDALRGFAPIAPLTSIANVLVVHPKVKAASLAELVRLAREAPGKLSYGSGGVGSVNHLAAELLKSRAKDEILHVPQKNATTPPTGLSGGGEQGAGSAALRPPPVRTKGRPRGP